MAKVLRISTSHLKEVVDPVSPRSRSLARLVPHGLIDPGPVAHHSRVGRQIGPGDLAVGDVGGAGRATRPQRLCDVAAGLRTVLLLQGR